MNRLKIKYAVAYMSYKRIKIIYMSVFVTREAGTLKAIFDFPMFNTTLCDFTKMCIRDRDNISIVSLYSENWGWKKSISENLSCNN